ncbi:hypothetical protein GS399_00230 [Pedobacter sp. HMF7647]|uniref:UbiA prenyltransferase family protein n=2 Tax=Hufsiella arboris TaxID=2695275 RepID=A0A7K1Y4N6_9SPHI|nr:hypothetical protein [Hufsiella arboris]
MALCAVAQGMVTYQLLNAQPDKYVLGLLFAATLALYNFSILLAKPADPSQSQFKRVRWFFDHYRLMISITIIAVLALIPLVLFLTTTSIILLGFLGVLSVSYNLPLFSFHEKKFGLRNIPGIKLFLIALVWSLSCVSLPIVELESHGIISVSSRDTILLLTKRFLFIAALAVPFDIRDLFQDRNYDLKTIPVVLGEKKAYLFCLVLLLFYLILLFLFNNGFDANFWGLAITIFLAGWLIFKSDRKKDEYYYFFYLDGVLILQFLFLSLTSLASR